MPTNLENRKRASRATGQRSSTRKRARAREKNKGDIFGWSNNMKFCACAVFSLSGGNQ